MSQGIEGWQQLPKNVKLLDVSIVGYSIILILALALYLLFIDQTIQNLMPIFLTALLLILTWNFRTQIKNSDNITSLTRYYREWLLISGILIVLIVILIFIYPVTY
ncbi:MAG: hypothetical protein EAX86_08765 [Candidatus Heimdallarchaeota archaeon]|nr:hypothetical protein [Candidatus Heimdallarchaeota archaeon]